MYASGANTEKKATFPRALLLVIAGVLMYGTTAWASTRFGQDLDIQAWYRTRNTFQTDGKEHFDWVQWRNEAFIWLTYENLKEGLNKRAVGYGQAFPFLANLPQGYRDRRGHILVTTPVWRSMVGFDLQQSLASYRGLGWMRDLPGQIGTHQSFLSFQWLMQYNFEGLSNNMCNWNFAEGIGPSAPTDGPPTRPAIPGCRTNHWNHFFTVNLSGQGYFHSKLEQRLAMAFEPRGQQWLLYGQWWWRNFWSLPIDLSMGTSWFPGSRMDNSWTLLNYFTNRNLLWFEGTYYVL